MRYFKFLGYKLVFLCILLTSIILFLLTTNPGFHLSLKLLKLLPGELYVENPQGRIIDNFSFASFSYKNKQFDLTLKNVNVKWQWGNILKKELIIDNLQVSKLEFVSTNFDKSKEKNKINFPKLPLNIIINQASIEKISLKEAHSSSIINLTQFALKANLNNHLWQISQLNFKLPAMDLILEANVQGTSQHLISTVKIKSPQGGLDFNLAYDELKNPKIDGKLKANFSNLKGLNLALQQLKLHSEFSGDSIESLNLNSELDADYFGNLVHGFINYQNQQVKSEFSLGKNQISIIGSPPYRWQIKANISEPTLLNPQLKNLQTGLSVNAQIDNLNNGNAILNIEPGSYKLGENNRLQFVGGEIRAKLSPQKLQINGQLIIDQDKSLLVNFALPKFQLNKGLSNSQKIEGDLNLTVNSLGFLQNFSSELSQIEGQLRASLNASGTVAKPVLEGKLSVDQGRVSMSKLGLDFNPVHLNLLTHDKQWDLKGSLNSQGQQLNLSGQGRFFPKAEGAIRINAANFTVLKTEEYLINISPELLLTINPDSLSFTGKILIPNAQIKPQTFTEAVSLSSDVVLVSNKPASSPNPLHINTDISIEMGNEVALNVKGLQGFLMGTIHLRQLPDGPLNASGQLNIREGKYKAYGQDLTIDQGELLFTGGLIDNPGINLRASRNFSNSGATALSKSRLLDFNSANQQTLNLGENTTVGVLVTGRLKSPRVALFSEPSALSQADILSMLILGRPAAQANGAGGQLLLKAVTSMNPGSDSRGLQLVDQLKQTLGLDVDLKTQSKLDVETQKVNESNSVVVGKSLTKRIYLSYNFGLAKNDANVVTLTYLLNKFFSLQVNTSIIASSIDLLYTHKKENTR